MYNRYTLRTFLVVLALVGVVIGIAIVPTNRAQKFANSFEGKVDCRELLWLDAELRNQIHVRTSELGLAPSGCAFYRAELQPISVADFVGLRRRVLIRHHGAWDTAMTTDPASSIAVMVDYLNGSLVIEIDVGLLATVVH